MFRDGGDVRPMAANEQHYLPHGKRASLDVRLPASRGIAKVDERELRPPEAFLNQPCAGIAGCPAMASRHTLEAISALGRQTHADDDGTRRAHRISMPYIVIVVTIVARILFFLDRGAAAIFNSGKPGHGHIKLNLQLPLLPVKHRLSQASDLPLWSLSIPESVRSRRRASIHG